MGRGNITKSPAASILRDHVIKGIPKEMGGNRMGDSNDKSRDHSISQQSKDRTEHYGS